jgi:hypothetical protein
MYVASVLFEMLHMFQWLYTYVARVCSKCFICFRCILQQVLYVVSVFISRRGKRAQVEAVPMGAPEAKWARVVPTCMHSSRRGMRGYPDVRTLASPKKYMERENHVTARTPTRVPYLADGHCSSCVTVAFFTFLCTPC